MRELVADVLTGLGHSVTVAGGGREGLARFETGRYDLVLTDLGMPDFNGWDVARAVKAARPDVPVLLLTGWADAADPAERAARRGDHQEALRPEAARGGRQPGARPARVARRAARRRFDGRVRGSPGVAVMRIRTLVLRARPFRM